MIALNAILYQGIYKHVENVKNDRHNNDHSLPQPGIGGQLHKRTIWNFLRVPEGDGYLLADC